jgi:acyl-homoserine-lactone acylase
MRKIVLLLAWTWASCSPPEAPNAEVAAWEQRAERVTIIRDDWGIPHVYGETDADAVFGLMYAQAEDDFNRVETNFLNSQGRLAEAEGEEEIYRDLRMKLFVDPDDMRAQYAASPDLLKSLMDAWADGLNFYLHAHPEVTPRVITRFEPWMALTFSEGSIGGDIERVDLDDLEAFYGSRPENMAVEERGDASVVASGMAPGGLGPVPDEAGVGPDEVAPSAEGAFLPEPTGSNGIAIAPSNSASGNALFLINPHTSFFFRAEVHVVSNEGLNAYGAVTWGQFFVYQGFNDRAGWMHTSSRVDNIDEYLETVVERDDAFYYLYGDEERPITARRVTVPYRTDTGMARREFTVYRTHHGPVVREEDGKWVSIRLMEEPTSALTQSYLRTKARSLNDFVETLRLHTNSSNNTVYADADGNIAYFHSNFVPERDTRFDWDEPVDGSDPTTDWQGVHPVEESPNSLNPSVGWIQNTNNWPYSAAGPDSPEPEDFPSYMDRGSENPRGIHAIRVLENKADFTLSSLIQAAYSTQLPAFEQLIPSLVAAYDQAPASSPFKEGLGEQIEALRGWDHRWSVESVPTALAVLWGEELMRQVNDDARTAGVSVYEYMATRTSAEQRLETLAAVSDRLEEDFGSWRTPWGEINRYQRLTGDIDHPFDDEGPSIPVGFTSGRWGSLASFGARRHDGSRKLYGTSGNSFVAVVEFGDTLRARAITAGGQSGDPASPHFNDQAERYSTGNLREVYFYRSQLEGHTEREYHPGG